MEIIPSNISNCVSFYNTISIKSNKNSIKIYRDKSSLTSVSNYKNIDQYKRFLISYYDKNKNLLDLNINLLKKIEEKILTINFEKDIFKYFPSFPIKTSFFHPIEIVRGCPQGCKYCQVSNIFGRKFRKKDIDIVKIFLKYQIRNKKNHIRFISPDFTLFFMENSEDKNSLDNYKFSILNLIDFINNEAYFNNIEPFIYLGSFPSELSLRFLQKDYLNILSKFSATKKITIGIQTVSNRLQKIIGRNDPLDKLEETLNYCVDNDLEPIIDIILGLPYETQEDRMITIDFLEKNCKGKISANLHYFLPLPGSEFENEKPTPISSGEIKKIQKIMGKGYVCGNFFKQMNDYYDRIEIPTKFLCL